MTNAPERRWFQFSLRTLFAWVAVFAIWLAWITWQFEVVRERETLMNAHVGWDMSNDQTRLPFVWSLLGASPVNSISLPTDEFSDDDRARYRSAFPEADVTLEEQPFDIATKSRKRWANRHLQDRKWTEAWISARNALDALAIVAVVALVFEVIRPRTRRIDPAATPI